MDTETNTISEGQIEVTSLSSRVNPKRELTQYVFCIADHIEPLDKVSFGTKVGGIWLGHSEAEGVPQARRFKYFLATCRITPIETVALPKRFDHISEEKKSENFLIGAGVPSGTRGYSCYAGDGLSFLKLKRFSSLGIVDFPKLEGINWETKVVEKIQKLFFPKWDDYMSGKEEFPKTIDERETIIKEAMDKFPTSSNEHLLGQQMLESGRAFRVYAFDHIEKNRQLIQSLRNVNMGGFYVSWSAKSRLYAEQLGIRLENDVDLRNSAQEKSESFNKGLAGLFESLLSEMKAERQARNEEMTIQSQNIQLLTLALLNGKDISKEMLEQILVKGNSTELPKVEVLDKIKETTSEDPDKIPESYHTVDMEETLLEPEEPAEEALLEPEEVSEENSKKK